MIQFGLSIEDVIDVRPIIHSGMNFKQIDKTIERSYNLAVRQERDFGEVVSEEAYPLVTDPKNFYEYVQDLIEYEKLTKGKIEMLMKTGLTVIVPENHFPNCDIDKSKKACADVAIPTENYKWGYVNEDFLFDSDNEIVLGMGKGQLILPDIF